MLPVEDKAAKKTERVVVFDGFISLGQVRAGRIIKRLNVQSLLKYYAKVKSRLFDYVQNYPDAYLYRPVQSDEIMMPTFGTIYQDGNIGSEELADYFLISPLIKIKSQSLPLERQRENNRLIHQWAMWPPSSTRLYQSQDLRRIVSTNPGWACVLDIRAIEEFYEREREDAVTSYILSELPVFVELDEPDELDALLKWLITLKNQSLPQPYLIMQVKSHVRWGDALTRLLDIPNSMITTAGATIGTLSTLIKEAKKRVGDEWARRFIFASNYPNIDEGDGVPDILSYLLSKSLSARLPDIQRILAGNLFSILPPRPPFLSYINNDISIIAENQLGIIALNEITRILRLLATRGEHGVISLDRMMYDDGSSISDRCYVLTIREGKSDAATNLAILLENDGTLRVKGWRTTFDTMLMERNAKVCSTLIRAASQSNATVLGSPSHLKRFIEELLRGLRVINADHVIASLQYRVKYGLVRPGSIAMHPSDIEAIRLTTGMVIIHEPATQNWGVARVIENPVCPQKTIIISREDADFLNFKDPTLVDVIAVNNDVIPLKSASFTYELAESTSEVETATFMAMQREAIEQMIRDHFMEECFRFWVGSGPDRISIRLLNTEPELQAGEIGSVRDGKVAIYPSRVLEDYNVIMASAIVKDTTDISLGTRYSLSGGLPELIGIMPDVMDFISGLRGKESRLNIFKLATFLMLNLVLPNKTDGMFCHIGMAESGVQSIKVFLARTGDSIGKIYSHILQDEQGEPDRLDTIFQTIDEMLADMNSSVPTLVQLFTDRPLTTIKEYLHRYDFLNKYQNVILSVFWMGRQSDDDSLEFHERLHLIPVEEFKSHIYVGYVLSTLKDLLSL